MQTAERKRLEEVRLNKAPWRKFGPYLSERQWGTVREDYSEGGEAWEYFPHDHARSRAYRWGEEGIAGISDDKQLLCFALSLWNGKDPLLKERLFGLTGPQGNHGEDVKEYYFYLDNLPTHAYMKYLYKYPHNAYPYEALVNENARRSRFEMEYELLDTGIFDEDRYFDIFIEYAKASPEDLLIKITVENRGPENARLHLFPTLWFRNTWSWTEEEEKPTLELLKGKECQIVKAVKKDLGEYFLYCDQRAAVLFTDNETNCERLFQSKNASSYVKDGINDYIVLGKKSAVNPANQGTKAAVVHEIEVKAHQSVTVKLRLCNRADNQKPFGKEFDQIFQNRIDEANAFYEWVTPFAISDDMRNVQRQAFAGLLWNKQFYHYNVDKWLKGDPKEPRPPKERLSGRNRLWKNLDAYDIFSMPDKWEYPWFAAWDLAFHTISLSLIDPEFAKNQLHLLMREWYMHPDGQIPAYEWEFGDVNPPVHAWAAMRIYQIEAAMYGRNDIDFLKKMLHKLTLNFTWWVNRKDDNERNIFEGGFLGLDNIGIFNRSSGSPIGGILEQCDGTGWMGMYCLNLLQIALEIAKEDPSYQEMATKFFEHFVAIADAINNIGEEKEGLWDEEKGFYYGAIRCPNGERIQLTYNTILGVIPLFATIVKQKGEKGAFPEYQKRFDWLVENRFELVKQVIESSQEKELIALADPKKVGRILEKVLNENCLLSPYGIRSVSSELKDHPFTICLGGREYALNYEPAESTTPLFGGNSNWRGPIWFPINYLLIESLQKYHYYLGDDFKVECPYGSQKMASLWEVSSELSHRLIKIFLKDENGKRPLYGGIEKFQNDPHWSNYILFHEYFHGDNGAGLGASNQTGWTGLVAKLIFQVGKYASLTKKKKA